MKKKATPESLKPSQLVSLPPEEIYNPDIETTWKSTLIGLLFLSLVGGWMYYVYLGYEKWRTNGDSLPETGIVKVGIPVFLLAIILEFSASKIMGIEVYRLNDSMSSLGTGLIQQIVEVLTGLIGDVIGVTLVTGIPYTYIHENYRLMSVTGIPGFIGMFLMRDLGYYWFHRAAHRVAFMWAVHGVHHRPNEFNYSVSLSQGALQRWTELPFYAFFALFFPVELYILLYPIAKIYGFFTHTRLFSGMGYLKYIFVTPSLHRVHHASAPSLYIDKNYGEVFSFWDRLFGTFQEEGPHVVYGTVEPIDSWDPWEANLSIWRKIVHKAESCKSFQEKLLCFIKPPGWDPKTGGEYPLPDTTPWSSKKYDSSLNWPLTIYVIINYIVALFGGIVMLQLYKKLPSYWSLFFIYFSIIYSLSTIGKLYDKHPQFLRYEIVRLLLHIPIVYHFINLFGENPLYSRYLGDNLLYGTVGFVVVSFLFIITQRDQWKPETKAEWEKRVWIPGAGREFAQQLKEEQKKK